MKNFARLIKLLILTASVAPAVAMSAPAPIQPEQRTGSRIPANPERISGQERRRIFLEFVACVHRKKPNKVDYFIRHSDDVTVSSDIKDVSEYLDLPGCMADGAIGHTTGVEGRFQVRSLRGWLAELAYVTKNRTLPTAPVASVLPRNFFAIGSELIQAQGLGEFADCLATTDAEKLDVLVRTAWGSPEERVAAQSLAPILGQCLPQGLEAALRVESIRSYAASGLWQRFEAGKPLGYEGRP